MKKRLFVTFSVGQVLHARVGEAPSYPFPQGQLSGCRESCFQLVRKCPALVLEHAHTDLTCCRVENSIIPGTTPLKKSHFNLPSFGFGLGVSCHPHKILPEGAEVNIVALFPLRYRHDCISCLRAVLANPDDFLPPFRGKSSGFGLFLSTGLSMVRVSINPSTCCSVNLLSFPVTWTQASLPSRTSLFTVFTPIPRISATSLALKSF